MQYVCGTITTGANSTGVSVVVKRNGVQVATPTGIKVDGGLFMYSAPVDVASGYTTQVTCNCCSASVESSPAETVSADEWQAIDVAVCSCSCS